MVILFSLWYNFLEWHTAEIGWCQPARRREKPMRMNGEMRSILVASSAWTPSQNRHGTSRTESRAGPCGFPRLQNMPYSSLCHPCCRPKGVYDVERGGTKFFTHPNLSQRFGVSTSEPKVKTQKKNLQRGLFSREGSRWDNSFADKSLLICGSVRVLYSAEFLIFRVRSTCTTLEMQSCVWILHERRAWRCTYFRTRHFFRLFQNKRSEKDPLYAYHCMSIKHG